MFPRVYQKCDLVKFGSIFFIAIFFGLISITSPLYSIILTALFFLILRLFLNPVELLVMALLVAFSFMSFINEDWFRLPYAFRVRDVMFILVILTYLFGVLSKSNWEENKILTKYKIIFVIIVSVVIIQIIFTMVHFDASLSSCFRIGRRYLYLLLFFPASYFLNKKKKVVYFIKLLVIWSFFVSVMYVLQCIVKNSFTLIPFPTHAEYQKILGLNIFRIYIDGTELINLTFFISTFVFITNFYKNKKIQALFLVVMVFSGLTTFLFLSRTKILSLTVALITLILILIKKGVKLKFFLFTVIFLLFFCFVLSFTRVTLLNKVEPLFLLRERVASTFTDLFNMSGTFNFRIQDSGNRINLIKKNFIFGVGLLHDESKKLTYAKGFNEQFRTRDSAFISFLFDFGVVGAIILSCICYFVFKDIHYLLKKLPKESIEFGILASILCVLLMYMVEFFTGSSFMSFGGFATIGIFFAIINNFLINCSKTKFSE